jgi:hypothetical protein
MTPTIPEQQQSASQLTAEAMPGEGPFAPAERESLHQDDKHAAGAVFAIMVAIFTIAVIMYTIVAFVAMGGP